MSKYTTEVRFICESMSGLSESADGAMVDDIIASARPKIFNFDYPIFDEAYREVIESKILRHYYTREIGLETVGLWKLKLETKLTEIMPYYNKLYNSELLEFNPLYDTNYTRSGHEQVDQSENIANSLSSSDSTSLNTSQSETATGSQNERNSMIPETFTWDLHQETPQNGLTGVAEMNYLTTADKHLNGGTDYEYKNRGENTNRSATENQNTASRSSTNSKTDRVGLDTKEYLESIVGYRSKNPSKLLQDYRKTFLNIDLLVINELESLFMQLW